MFKKDFEIYGFVKTSDGTQFTIINKKNYDTKQVRKLRSKLQINQQTLPSELCLYNCGEIYDVDDILNMEFCFEDDHPEAGCINFLNMLEFPAKIAAVMHQSKFNQFMIKYILNNPKMISDSVIKELALTQNILELKDFIISLNPTLKFRFFTENPCRTKENIIKYKENIENLVQDIILSQIQDNPISNLNFLDDDSECLINLQKLSKDFFNNNIDLIKIKTTIENIEIDSELDILIKIEDIDYVISSIENNPNSYNEKDNLIKSFKNKKGLLLEDYKNIEKQKLLITNFYYNKRSDL